MNTDLCYHSWSFPNFCQSDADTPGHIKLMVKTVLHMFDSVLCG